MAELTPDHAKIPGMRSLLLVGEDPQKVAADHGMTETEMNTLIGDVEIEELRILLVHRQMVKVIIAGDELVTPGERIAAARTILACSRQRRQLLGLDARPGADPATDDDNERRFYAALGLAADAR